MKTWRKELSLLLVGMMIMSGLVAFSAPALADVQVTFPNPPDASGFTYTILWNTNNMIDHPEYNAQDEPIIINVAGMGNRLIYLGDDTMDAGMPKLQMTVQQNTDPGVDVTYTVISGNSLITVGDDDGGVWATGGAWPPAGGVIDFDIIVGRVGTVETSYDMTLRISEAQPTAVVRNLQFKIYVSSLFHLRGSDVERDTPHDFTLEADANDYVRDGSGGDAPFEAGDSFKPAIVTFQNRATFPVKNPQINLTAPVTTPANQIALVGATFAKFVGTVGAGNNVNLNWRVNVEAQTPPGVYHGTAIVHYTTTVVGVDKDIRENVRDIDYTVDYSFKDTDPYTPGADTLWSEYQCYATNVVVLNDTRQIDYVADYPDGIPAIQQDTYTDRLITVEVTIVNNGNSDLYNVEFEIIPGTATTEWDYFRNPRFFWTSAAGISYDTISRTVDLPVGESETFTLTMTVLRNIPIGEHRLPILYRGYYFGDGSLGGSTGFSETNGGDDLQVIMSIRVDDSVVDCLVHDVNAGDSSDKQDIVANTISLSIENLEEYNFIHVTVRADFTGTPWYMPIIGMRDPLVWSNEANDVNPWALWAGGDDMELTFDVDTDPSLVPDRYPFQLEITAVIQETLVMVNVVLDYRNGCVIDFGGYGPKIQISAFTAEDIVPGKGFDMTLTIENVGDDTLRDVIIFVPTDDTEYWDGLWDVEKDFKEQFNWSNVFENWGSDVGGQVTWNGEFPDGMYYTMEDLDVDNVREIVEIALYIDGVYSTPGARISLIRILDLAPGSSFNVTFQMYADKDMVNGKPYTITVTVFGIDSDGSGDYVDGMDFTISVMSSLPGKSYNPVELNWFDAGLKALALFLFFIIVLAILLFVYNMFKGEPYDEDEDDFDFEDDEPFEPTPEPEAEVSAAPEAPETELIEP